MSVISIEKQSFQDRVLQSQKPVLVDFWAPWCGPCRMLSPVVEELSREHPEIEVVKVNVDEEPELAQRYQVMSIPMLVLIKNGKPVASSVGFKPKSALEAMIK